MSTCQFRGEIVVNHAPAANAGLIINRVLSGYTVNIKGSCYPPTLQPSLNQVGYDGKVVPVKFKFFSFEGELNFSEKHIREELERRDVRQATAYENVLACSSGQFGEMFDLNKMGLDQIIVMSVTEDRWVEDGLTWVCCVDVLPNRRLLRLFFAGQRGGGHSFPIARMGRMDYLVVGVAEA